MLITREDRLRTERAHVHAWPALRTADIGGWLWRCSGGGSQRANSVSTIGFHGASPEAAVLQAESRYAALGQPARFHTFEETSPSALEDLLQQRGYRQAESTITMFKRIETRDPEPNVEARNDPWPEWRNIYLGEITENRRAANTLIIERIPAPRAFFGFHDGAETVATALCVIHDGCAVIECVATRADARRRGAARSMLSALERWAGQRSADWLGLQVAAGNTPALTLYQRLGFVAGAMNRFWVQELAD
jgi:ribosomal protein S18 acetylase RimI-like enzyme